MGEEVEDVDAMLEAAFEEKPEKSRKSNGATNSDESKTHRSADDKKKKRKRSRSREKDRKQRSRSRSKEKKRKRSSKSRSPKRERKRSKSRERRRHSPHASGGGGFRGGMSPPPPAQQQSWPRIRSGTPPWRRNSPPRGDGRRMPGPERRDVMPFTPRKSPPRGAKKQMTAEERDARAVFIMQIGSKIRPRDLEEFFSSVGRVRDVRIITDSRTRKSKGIAYVEFWEVESVALALGLNGQRLLGAPLLIQPSQAEKNRVASSTAGGALGFSTPNQPPGPSKLYVGSLHFNITEDMLRGIFEPFGRVENIQIILDDNGRSRGYGFITVRFRTGMSLPNQAQQVLNMSQVQADNQSTPAIATQCFMLSNMFDPNGETEPGWEEDVKDDVIEECSKNGGALHIYVDKASAQGNVYIKCPSVASAVASVNTLHGRWFAGKVITANYVPVNNYHELFNDALKCTTPLAPSYKPKILAGGAAGAIY